MLSSTPLVVFPNFLDLILARRRQLKAVQSFRKAELIETALLPQPCWRFCIMVRR